MTYRIQEFVELVNASRALDKAIRGARESVGWHVLAHAGYKLHAICVLRDQLESHSLAEAKAFIEKYMADHNIQEA